MLNADEEALVCDLAETYHIFNYREMSPLLVATLAVGLRENSRIKIKMNDTKTSYLNLLLASILDDLNTLVWFKTEDAQHGRNRPQSILNALIGGDIDDNGNMSFESAEDFENYRKKLINKEEIINDN